MPANRSEAHPPKKRQRTAASDAGCDDAASSTCAIAGVELPKSFCCSLTLELMRDPVSTADGHTYERAAIARWFADGNTTSPKTGAALEHKSIIPNIALRHAIEEWAETNNAQHLLVPPPPSATPEPRSRDGDSEEYDIAHLPAVLALMHVTVESAEMQAQGCAALLELSGVSASNQSAVVAAGGFEAVVAAMRAHAGSAEVQGVACAALLQLTVGSADNKSAAAAAGGIDAVAAAMRAHTGSAQVQGLACHMLWFLTPTSVSAQSVVAKVGGVDAIVAAMRAHAGSAQVQEYACALLQNAGDSADNKSAIVAAGAIEATVAALRAHTGSTDIEDTGVLEFAIVLLGQLTAVESADNRSAAAAAGAVEAVVAAMRVNAEQYELQNQACTALTSLVYESADNASAIVAAGGIEAVSAAMLAHPNLGDTGRQLLGYIRFYAAGTAGERSAAPLSPPSPPARAPAPAAAASTSSAGAALAASPSHGVNYSGGGDRELEAGQRVVLHGLKRAAELNGREGVLRGTADAATGRWEVRLARRGAEEEEAKAVRVKAANLRPTAVEGQGRGRQAREPAPPAAASATKDELGEGNY